MKIYLIEGGQIYSYKGKGFIFFNFYLKEKNKKKIDKVSFHIYEGIIGHTIEES